MGQKAFQFRTTEEEYVHPIGVGGNQREESLRWRGRTRTSGPIEIKVDIQLQRFIAFKSRMERVNLIQP